MHYIRNQEIRGPSCLDSSVTLTKCWSSLKPEFPLPLHEGVKLCCYLNFPLVTGILKVGLKLKIQG